MSIEQKVDNVEIKRYPKKILTSFQLGAMISLMTSPLFSIQLRYYYQDVVGLEATYFMLAMNIFTIFNMFNDPVVGYLCDRSTKLTNKWGKRFPFIVMGAFPMALLILFIFIPPSVNQVGQWGVFWWLLISFIFRDTALAIYSINRNALLPDKFRHQEDRNYMGFLALILETFGLILGFGIPVLAVAFLGDQEGFFLSGILITALCIILFIFMIPGVREGPELRARRSILDEKERVGFFSGMKEILKNRNFIAMTSLSIAYSTSMSLIMTSIPYFVRDLLQMEALGEFIFIFYVVGIFIMSPVWLRLSSKIGIRRIALIGGLCLGFVFIPILFMPEGPEGFPLAIIVLIIWGLIDGSIISMMAPLNSAMIDDATIKSGKRQEGLYGSVGVFFGTWVTSITYTLTWIITTIFGTALIGLRIQMAIFPIIVMLIGVLLFWKLYIITPDEMKENTVKLKERNL